MLRRLQGKPEESQQASFVIDFGPAALVEGLKSASYRGLVNSEMLAKLCPGEWLAVTQENAECFLG